MLAEESVDFGVFFVLACLRANSRAFSILPLSKICCAVGFTSASFFGGCVVVGFLTGSLGGVVGCVVWVGSLVTAGLLGCLVGSVGVVVVFGGRTAFTGGFSITGGLGVIFLGLSTSGIFKSSFFKLPKLLLRDGVV